LVEDRLHAAPAKPLRRALQAHLYYRISVVPLMLPPLRERKTDIPLLADEFLRRFNEENERHLAFGPGALDVLVACYFPGNVRELELASTG